MRDSRRSKGYVAKAMDSTRTTPSLGLLLVFAHKHSSKELFKRTVWKLPIYASGAVELTLPSF